MSESEQKVKKKLNFKRKTIKKRISNNKVEKFLNSMNIKETFNNGNHNKKDDDSSRKTIRAYESDDEEYGEPYERENEEKIVSEKNNNETPANIMNWDKEKLESFDFSFGGISDEMGSSRAGRGSIQANQLSSAEVRSSHAMCNQDCRGRVGSV